MCTVCFYVPYFAKLLLWQNFYYLFKILIFFADVSIVSVYNDD